MLNLGRTVRMVIFSAVIVYSIIGQMAHAEDTESYRDLMEKYHKAGDTTTKREAGKKLLKARPKTHEDMEQLKKLFTDKTWSESYYRIVSDAIERIPYNDTSLDDDLIAILRDEKLLMADLTNREKIEKENEMRIMNITFIIEKLGTHQSRQAAPILKEYLSMKHFQYYASQALGRIGDKSAKEDIRDKAYKGDAVNYGGMVEDETDVLFRDLQDETKKDKWKKMANQLTHVRSPKTKATLKKLFDHKDDYVRNQASQAFYNMVTKDDAADLVQMAKHRDFVVRADAVKAMMYLKDIQFDDILIDVLANDGDWLPRSKAARALGLKKVQKAVPYLEKALNDKEYYVRLEAFISLYVLTDKKYKFNGKSPTDDRMAENQKKFPKINW